MVFQGSFHEVSSMFQECFKKVSRVFHKIFKGVLRNNEGSFQLVPRVFDRISNEISGKFQFCNGFGPKRNFSLVWSGGLMALL